MRVDGSQVYQVVVHHQCCHLVERGGSLAAVLLLQCEYMDIRIGCFNSLALRRPVCHFETTIFYLVLLIGIFTATKDDALRWMPRDLTDDKSILVQVMAWCPKATSHYLSQCWPSSMSPYGVTRSQWVKKEVFISVINSSWETIAHHHWCWLRVISIFFSNRFNTFFDQLERYDHYFSLQMNKHSTRVAQCYGLDSIQH